MGSPRFLYQNFKKHKKKGLRYLDTNNNRAAHYHLLKGAEYLLKLARETKEEDLREIRRKNARKLMNLARNIDTDSQRDPTETPQKAEASEEPSASDWIITEKPSETFSDVAGLENVKEQIRIKMIYPFTHPEKAETYRIQKGGGLLLYGPPGTGKTLMARAIAGELDATFFSITPGQVLSKYVGEAEKNIEDLFDEAREVDKSVIFLDEIESLLPKRRDSQSPVMQRLVPQILSELDGFEGFDPERGVLFVGATNEPWSLDYASMRPGRFDEKIYVPLPDLDARKKILSMNLEGVPLAEDVDLQQLAEDLGGYSGADIVHLCRKVCERSFQKAVEEDDSEQIRQEHFDRALDTLAPSVSDENLNKFDEFRENISEQ